MLYIQEQTQDSNTNQSPHHIDSEEELQKNEKEEYEIFQKQLNHMQKIELQFNQQNFKNQFYPIRQQQKENLIVENILQQEDNQDMGRTPNQLSDILEDEREAEIENALSKGTCNFGNSYSRANNSIFAQTQQIQSLNSSQSQNNVNQFHGIGIGLKELSSSINSQKNQQENLNQKFKDEKNIQLIYQKAITNDFQNQALNCQQLINEKENIIVSNNLQQNDESHQKQKSVSILNKEQDQHEQEIIIQSSRKLQNFIEEKRIKEKILNQENPTLKPTDLEDLANIFDRIRILFKKKSNSNQPQPKKLILKNNGPTDDLAIQFDQKLTDIMFQLSKVLKDNLVTCSQKNAEIEKSKYLLYIYCNQTCIKFISKYKGNILQKDAKEVEIILTKLNEILNQSFIKMVNFFYTKEDVELKLISQMQIENLTQRCQQYDEMQQKYNESIQEINANQNEIINLKESFLNQSLRLEEQHYQLKKSEENFNELIYARDEICKLRQQMNNYEQVINENQQIKNELVRLKDYVQDFNKLKKSAQIKEKECQKLKRMINHLHEEIKEMKEEGMSLFDENQKYLDMIVRYSLGQDQGQNGGMKINLDWLKQRIMRKKKSIYDGLSAFDYKSQMSQSNLSISPILRSQKFNKNSMLNGLNNGKNNKKLNDVSIRSIQSQNSSNAQNIFKQQLKNETIISEIDDKRGKSFEDKIKNGKIRNMLKSSKFGEKLGLQNESIFPKDGGYSHIHSYRKSYKKIPINQEFNLSFQQNKDRQNNKSLIFKQKTMQEKEYDKDLESEKSNFLIKSQNSQKSLDVFKNNQGEEQEEIQKTAAKKLIKVESQLIEKSFTKEILGIKNNRNMISPQKFDENFGQIKNNNDQKPISVEDCEPSPPKQFHEDSVNFNQFKIEKKNKKLMKSQNEMKLILGSLKNSNLSNEMSENEQFLRQEKEVFLSLQNQNINANSKKKVPHLNLQDNENKFVNQFDQQKHQRTFSASNYMIGYFQNGINDYQYSQPYNTQIVHTKRSKSASPQHNKEILYINTKNTFINYNLNQNNTNLTQNQYQLQDIIKHKLQQIDIIQLNRFNQNDQGNKLQNFKKIRDFQPLQRQAVDVLSPDLKKNSSKNCKYSLKQIRELITDIYIQKVKHDDKCINMIHQNRETMQQFLCTYLNQKYGLKQIVLEQANAIIQAIGDYQFIDHDVLLFKKVLRNQLDEEFRYVQITIKNTVYQLMKTLLAQKYASKTSHEIQRIIHDIEIGKISIDNWLWQKILNQMYDQTDQFIIHEKLKKMQNLFIMEKQYISESKSTHPVLATNLRAESRKRSKELTGRRSVGYNRNSFGSQNFQNQTDPDKQSQKEANKKLSKFTSNPQNNQKYQFQIFMETILLFQLNEHEKFLQKFMQLFQSIDINQSGIISNQQFILLCKKMNVQHDEKNYPNQHLEEINQLLDIVDPYQCNKITLSDIILLFSKHNLSMLEGNILKSSNKKQVLNIDYSVVGLNKLNDLEKSQSFSLNIAKKNIDDQLNLFQSNTEQTFTLQLNNDLQKNFQNQSNMQKQIFKQKLGELQQIDETTESNILFTNENSRQASNQISLIEKSNYLDQYNIQMVNQNSYYNQQKPNDTKETLGSMETIQKISEDEKRITYEIMMLEKKLENKI